MNDYITVGAASLLGSLILATALVRWAVAPTAARNRRAGETTIEIPLAGLRAWPQPTQPALGTQAFRRCGGCRAEVPVVVHGDAHRCEQGHVTITGGAR
ncbi:hypothetical protein AB0C88_37845 [Streptomyces chartreusis]|uniref:hypothetical protein n=1 Tax=Streptomyces chartreusis TaxID=1969 RepID=UPI0033CED0CC